MMIVETEMIALYLKLSGVIRLELERRRGENDHRHRWRWRPPHCSTLFLSRVLNLAHILSLVCFLFSSLSLSLARLVHSSFLPQQQLSIILLFSVKKDSKNPSTLTRVVVVVRRRHFKFARRRKMSDWRSDDRFQQWVEGGWIRQRLWQRRVCWLPGAWRREVMVSRYCSSLQQYLQCLFFNLEIKMECVSWRQ
mgnify:CR=1 FL=1